jgi:hypothetical protein
MRVRLLLVALCSLAGAAAVPCTAAAAPTLESEPNDTVFQRTGPISTEGAEGSIATANDLDTFLVRLRPQRQVKVTYSILNRPACTASSSLAYSLRTPSGSSIDAPSGSDYLGSSQSSYSYPITTPGVFGGPSQDYLLRFSASGTAAVGCRYRFTVTGSAGEATDAIDPSPLPTYPIVTVAEPNDLDAQATGPMQADTVYAGALETSNDADLLFVPIKGGTAPTFELTADGGDVYTRITERGGERSTVSLDVDRGNTDSATPAAASADLVYLVTITGDTGASWRLRVTPPLAVGVTAIAPPAAPQEQVFTPIARQVSLSRTAGRYRGRITSSAATCNRNVKVTLRRTARPGRSYGSARTRSDGSWTIRRASIPGKVYAEVAAERIGAFDCAADTSRILRRR